MSRETKKIIICVTNKCPFCGERGYSEGEDSVKIGEEIKCEKCGKKFEVLWYRNVKGEKEIPYENVPDYHKEKVWHECPNCKKKILLSLVVKKGDSVITSEIIGIDKP